MLAQLRAYGGCAVFPPRTLDESSRCLLALYRKYYFQMSNVTPRICSHVKVYKHRCDVVEVENWILKHVSRRQGHAGV